MENYEYGTDGKCTYGLDVVKSCRHCLFETLCSLEQQRGKAILEAKKTIENN